MRPRLEARRRNRFDARGPNRYPVPVSSTSRSRPAFLRRESPSGPGSRPGTIDYRLARRHTVAELKRGRLSRVDVCDAHPELLRAARNCGERADEDCPVCGEHELVNVSYVFGARMPASGRVADRRELARLARRTTSLACYVVEVCPACSWNYLARTFTVGRPSAP